MDARLVQLLRSFLSATDDYTLARLEFSVKHPRLALPPTIDRFRLVSDETLRAEWGEMEERLELVRRALRNLNDRRGKRAAYDQPFATLQRIHRQLDHYARAVRWVMTVEDHHTQS